MQMTQSPYNCSKNPESQWWKVTLVSAFIQALYNFILDYFCFMMLYTSTPHHFREVLYFLFLYLTLISSFFMRNTKQCFTIKLTCRVKCQIFRLFTVKNVKNECFCIWNTLKRLIRLLFDHSWKQKWSASWRFSDFFSALK